MILANGKVYDTARQGEILAELEGRINATLAGQRLEAETVIAAIHTLGEQLAAGAFDPLIASLELDGVERYVGQIAPMLRREALEYKLRTELGGDTAPYTTTPPDGLAPLTVRPAPLGVLLHIAAGNVDGLPAYSVVEGLLTGNINILKLPQADNGLSIEILRQLIAVEPALADFIYVFDTPSTDLPALRQMAALSDGIVVWGGDGAVSAVRRFAPPGVKLMEWGHRLSFAYLSGEQDRERDWTALAEHIMSTRQLLCSSCQTIFLDTDSMEDVHAFCRAFLPCLERAAAKYPAQTLGAAAEHTLRRYEDRVERAISGQGAGDGRVTYHGKGCSVTACPDRELELSDLFGRPLVKALPRRDVLPALRRHKGHLQTVGLLCPEGQRGELAGLFLRCGLTRILRAGTMSDVFCGEAHDGEYPLRRYTRMVDIQ